MSLRAEVGEELLYALAPLFLRAERLQRRELSLPFVHHVEHVVLHRPADMVRRAPHEEIREIQMTVFVISGTEEPVEHRLILFAKFLEFDDMSPPVPGIQK